MTKATTETVVDYVRRWIDTCPPLKALLHRRAHEFGPEMLMVAKVNGVEVSERRVRICNLCGATDAMAAGGHACKEPRP